MHKMYSLPNCFTILARKGRPLDPVYALITINKNCTQNLAYRLHVASISDILSVKGSVFMARTSNVFARVEPDIKEQAEAILAELGIPMSNAVGMFLRQIVMQRGIPFEMKLPASAPLAYGNLTKEQFIAEIGKGMADIENGNVVSADEAESYIRQKFSV